MNRELNWSDLTAACPECGQEFIPDESGQICCSNDCAAIQYDWDANNWEEEL